MKIVIRAAIYNFLCILIFGLIYVSLRSDLTLDPFVSKQVPPDFLDFFSLSTSIQSGVGIATVYPMGDLTKLVIMLQQYCMILSNLMLLYFFTV